ncbi:hypothetical protein BZA77DRAFT_322431 [Pyronema omphalodes]|nr:hypothetical protein BZA77DRAFT_322431 [Pyronema omphalodes]
MFCNKPRESSRRYVIMLLFHGVIALCILHKTSAGHKTNPTQPYRYDIKKVGFCLILLLYIITLCFSG